MLRLIFTTLFLSAFIAHAQIKMNSSGRVAIGISSPHSSYSVQSGSFYTGSTFYLGGYTNGIIFDFYGTGARRLRPTGNNKGQIGNSSYAFNKMYSYSYVTISDKRQKENIRGITSSLEKVKLLKGVKYDFREEVYDALGDNVSRAFRDKVEKERKNHIGFLAQDVMEVLPEAVVYDDTTDVYAVDYTKVIPLLVEAIKEQQVQIEQLSRKLESNNSVNGSSVEDQQSEDNTSGDYPKLLRNVPNPFSDKTEINYYLPSSISKALLIVYDMNGKLLRNESLETRGQGRYEIRSGDLGAGIYFYSIIADGESLGTHKMIVN